MKRKTSGCWLSVLLAAFRSSRSSNDARQLLFHVRGLMPQPLDRYSPRNLNLGSVPAPREASERLCPPCMLRIRRVKASARGAEEEGEAQ